MRYFWNIVFSVFFAFIMILGIWWLADAGRFSRVLSFADFTLMALAIVRLIRLFAYDHITEFLRDLFKSDNPTSFTGTLHALLICPWCIGLWFSYFVMFFYFATPYAWPVILVLALAAVASFLQILTNLVGWNAEAKKRMVEGSPTGTGGTCG